MMDIKYRRYLDNTLAGRSNQSKVATHFTQLLSSIATQVSTNQELPTPLSSGFITMNSYNRSRNMSPKGMRKQAMPAPKLMAIENEYLRTKDALEWEIRRLRGEVGVLVKRYNNARREIEDLVRRVRSQPPPPIPKRDEETERRREEQNKRWKEHLERESKNQEEEKRRKKLEEEKEARKKQEKREKEAREKQEKEEKGRGERQQLKKVEELERMLAEVEKRSIAVMQKLQEPTPEPESSTHLIPDYTHLDQKPPSRDRDENEVQMTDVPEPTQLDDACSDVEMAATVRKEIKIAMDEKWLKRLRKKNREAKEKEYMQRAGLWWEDLMVTGNIGIEVDLEELEEMTEAVREEKKKVMKTKKYLKWAQEQAKIFGSKEIKVSEPIDAFFHLWATKEGQKWEVVFKKDHISVGMEREEEGFIFCCEELEE